MYKITIKHGSAELNLSENTLEGAEEMYLKQCIHHAAECTRIKDRCRIYLLDPKGKTIKQIEISSL